MKKKDFLQLVEAEALHLRNNATDKEKDNLDFDALYANSSTRCVYGQMTGTCDSDRAKELYPKTFYTLPMLDASFTQTKVRGFLASGERFTALEAYIIMKGAKKKSLLNYIKGNRKTFKA